MIGENVTEALDCDLKLEVSARALLQQVIGYCESSGDFVSRDILVAILDSEEEHIDWLETQLRLINEVGLQNYLQSQIRSEA